MEQIKKALLRINMLWEEILNSWPEYLFLIYICFRISRIHVNLLPWHTYLFLTFRLGLNPWHWHCSTIWATGMIDNAFILHVPSTTEWLHLEGHLHLAFSWPNIEPRTEIPQIIISESVCMLLWVSVCYQVCCIHVYTSVYMYICVWKFKPCPFLSLSTLCTFSHARSIMAACLVLLRSPPVWVDRMSHWISRMLSNTFGLFA